MACVWGNLPGMLGNFEGIPDEFLGIDVVLSFTAQNMESNWILKVFSNQACLG